MRGNAMGYRPEIDGLRTLAIAPVVIYHLKIPMGDGDLLPGGFLGVDIFLVLSGFLITKILLDEHAATGRISITNFYIRRARRILPALLLVILASMVVTSSILLPSEMDRFVLSVLAALGFVSNLFWFVELGEYGAQSGLLQPMLHTWSLAIEEQFYLVFPLLLIALAPARRPRATLWVMIALFGASLGLSEITTAWNRDLSFFSPVSRAWELLMGSLMAGMLTFYPNRLRPGPLLTWLLPKLGLAVLVCMMLLVDLNAVNHPGIVTVPAVLATACIIWAAHSAETVTRVFSIAPMVWIGKLSYSIYLWHFPIFAFARLTSLEAPGPISWLTWVALTLGCATLGYYLIEKPFRFRIKAPAALLSLAASLSAIGVFSGLALSTSLLTQHRSDNIAALYGVNDFDNELLRDRSWHILNQLAGPDELITKDYAAKPSPHEVEDLWFKDPDAFKLLIVGNSHAKDLFNALHSTTLDRPAGPQNLEVARFGMDARFPVDQQKSLFAAPNFAQADLILISTRYSETFQTDLPPFLDALQAQEKPVALVTNTPEFKSPSDTLPLFDWFIRRAGPAADPAALMEMNALAYASLNRGIEARNADLRAIAQTRDIVFLSRHDLMCDTATKDCFLITPEGRKTMYDYGHWTLEGAAFFGQRATELKWLAPFYSQ